jgi:hypothetical protein
VEVSAHVTAVSVVVVGVLKSPASAASRHPRPLTGHPVTACIRYIGIDYSMAQVPRRISIEVRGPLISRPKLNTPASRRF